MMKWVQRSLAVVGLLLIASSANAALSLRSPQVAFNGGPLQGYLNLVDAGINVTTGQLDAQGWSVAITGNTDFTLVLKSPLAVGFSVGVYNTPDAAPTLYQVFPSAAVPGWYAALHFGGGNLVVSLFDQNSNFMGQAFHSGVNQNSFGFYIRKAATPNTPSVTWYSQDYRNPGPQMLTYASNVIDGDYWLCWASTASDAASTFDDIVINIQSVRPVPAANSTWGALKAQYH